ncbi:MAG: hypothetical protein R3B84_15425 [Zavarzinella sp.]
MFIIWGEKDYFEKLGVVADFCPYCQRVHAFSIQKRFIAFHLYWITIGGWTRKETLKTCWNCGYHYLARIRDYRDFIPETEAEQTKLSQIIRQTNPEMLQWYRNPPRRYRTYSDYDEE